MGLLGAIGLFWMAGGFIANTLEARRLARRDPDCAEELPFKVTHAVMLSIIFLLLLGYGGHNLFRYNWLWFGSFQALAIHCIRNREESYLGGEQPELDFT